MQAPCSGSLEVPHPPRSEGAPSVLERVLVHAPGVRLGGETRKAFVCPVLEPDILDDPVLATSDVTTACVECALGLFTVVADGLTNELPVVSKYDVVKGDAGAARFLRRVSERCPGAPEYALTGMAGLQRCRL